MADDPLHPRALERCPSCGGIPLSSVEVGAGYQSGRIRCPRCGLCTTPGLTWALARKEWSQLVVGEAPGDG